MAAKPYARRELARRAREFGWHNRLWLTVIAGLCVLTLLVTAAAGDRGYAAGFVGGLFVATATGTVILLFLLHTGGLDQIAGMYGESRTKDELRKARRHRRIWGWHPNLELPDGDIDYLVFAPGGVLSLEVKWRTRALDRRWLGRDLAQAQRSATKVRSILRSRDTIGEVHDVTPVLVIWGKATLDIADGGEEHDGVHVIDGNDLYRWLAGYSTGPVTQDNAELALLAVQRFALTHRPPQAA